MKKKMLACLLLGLTMITNPASAAMDPGYAQEVLQDNNGWPLATLCTGTDVRVREEAATDCEIVALLQPGDIFYVKEVFPNANYYWCKGVTARGERGYVVINHLEQAPRAATRAERFRAAFMTSKIYNAEALAREAGVPFQFDPKKLTLLESDFFHYAPQKFKVGNSWVHGELFTDGSFQTMGVVITGPGQKVAGLEVGQKLTNEALDDLKRNLNLIGWDGPHKLEEENYWYVYDTVDRQERPVEGFALILRKGFIKEIRYWHIPID